MCSSEYKTTNNCINNVETNLIERTECLIDTVVKVDLISSTSVTSSAPSTTTPIPINNTITSGNSGAIQGKNNDCENIIVVGGGSSSSRSSSDGGSSNSSSIIGNTKKSIEILSSEIVDGTIGMATLSVSQPVSPCSSAKSLHRSSCTSVSTTAADDDTIDDEIEKIFHTKSAAIEKWLREKASNDIVTKLHTITDEQLKNPNDGRTTTTTTTGGIKTTNTNSNWGGYSGRKCSKNRKDESPKRSSVTSDLFQQWMASSPLKGSRSPTSRNSSITNREHLATLDEGELFMELIRDVANELDIDVLCHKILVNVGLLTHADRGSLFLAKEMPPHNRYLVAKLFDVTQHTALQDAVKRARSEEIIIPFGIGIAGSVAETKETINITEAYADPRFNRDIDKKTGYKTKLILSMPICNYEGDVIGVAQIINKTDDSEAFMERDVEVFGRYLTFCGIGIQNAQLFEMSIQEYRRNQILLNLARSIFEEQNNLECLVTKILTEARGLLKCERCAVFLLDLDCCESSHLQKIVEKPSQSHHQPLSRRQSHNVNVEDILAQQKASATFTMLFELDSKNVLASISRPTANELSCSTLALIAQKVASTGQIFNIVKTPQWLRDHPDIQVDNAIDDITTILCMPIVNGINKVIGVVQLINKEQGTPFTDVDVSILEPFAIFCGLGIHNTQMYENACKLMAKQKVALECLSYHATAGTDQTVKLVQDTIQSAEEYCLYSFKFVDFELNDDDTCRATVRMFLQCNLVQQFHIPYDVLCRWILSIRKNYRPLKYHNWRHALNVTQTMFAMMKTGKMERFVTDLEILGLLVACLCHDLDHRGTNNAFQTKTDSPLAILYTTSTMEHHHFDQCVMILNSEGNNIFQALSPEDYRRVMKIVETAILSTDLAMYFKKRTSFMELVENGEFDWQSEDKKEILCGMMMTACDVSAIAKPWEIQHRVAKLVADEFFDQGDMEKLQLNTQPIAMMDRERKDELPKMQVGFIDVICVPLYRMLSETFPWIRPLYEGTIDNRQHWQDLAEKVEMGLTWIDHDTIDKPVEEFSACPTEIKDIEFTVTTLNCPNANDHHDSSPNRRRKFSSLRKTGALSKVMRSRLSKSFYTSNCPVSGVSGASGGSSHSSTVVMSKKSDSVTITIPPVVHEAEKPNNGGASTSSSFNENDNKQIISMKPDKHKKRSKLCLIL